MPNQRRGKPALTFNHAMVYVRELAPALHFYADLLGFKMVEQYTDCYARLRCGRGGATLALHKVGPGESLPEADGVRLYFETDKLDELCRYLAEAGVRFEAPKTMPWGWKHAYLNDPDGHELSLYSAGRKRFQKSKMGK